MGSVRGLARSPHSIDWNLGQASASSLKSTQVGEFARTSVRRAPAALACATPDGVRAPGSIAAGSRPVVGSPSLFPWAGRPLAVPGGCERTLLSRFSCTSTAKQGGSCFRNAASGAVAPEARLPAAQRGVRRVSRSRVGHGGGEGGGASDLSPRGSRAGEAEPFAGGGGGSNAFLRRTRGMPRGKVVRAKGGGGEGSGGGKVATSCSQTGQKGAAQMASRLWAGVRAVTWGGRYANPQHGCWGGRR